MSDKFRPTIILPIPGLPSDCPQSLMPVLDAIKVNLETGIGERAKPTGVNYDQWVRTRQLVDKNFLRSIGFPVDTVFKPADSTDKTPPGPPSNFVVIPGEWTNSLSWTNPTDEDFAGIEVWRGTVDDVNLAELIINLGAPTSAWDDVIHDYLVTYYYWIRSVDFSGNKSVFVGMNDGTNGAPAPGNVTIGNLIDKIMEVLHGYRPAYSIYNPSKAYYYGDRVLYAGADGIDRTYKCIVSGGGSITGEPPLLSDGSLNITYWVRSGILIEGDVDGMATVGVDGNLVVDQSILARSIKTDGLVVGDNISIKDGAIFIAHIGDTTQILNSGTITGTIGTGGQAAATVRDATVNFNNRNDRVATAITNPTWISPYVTRTDNKDGSVDLTIIWDWSQTWNEYLIDGFELYYVIRSASGAYTFGTSPSIENVVVVPADKRVIVIPGVPSDQYYSFAVRAYRVVDADILSSQIMYSTLIKLTATGFNPYRPKSTVDWEGLISGVSHTNVGDGATRAIGGLAGTTYRVAKAIKASIMGDNTPDAAGLWMTSSYLGYYNGSSWPVYIKNDGDFWFGKDANNYFAYTGGNLIFATAQANGFRVLGGGSLYVYSSGNIVLTAQDSNPSELRFTGTHGTMKMVGWSGYNLYLHPSVDAQGNMILGADNAGTDPSGGLRVYSARMYGRNDVQIYGNTTSIRMETHATYGKTIYCEGHLRPLADATYDVGSLTGVTRKFRDGYFSRNMDIGGTLAVGGVTTVSGNILPGSDAAIALGNTSWRWASIDVYGRIRRYFSDTEYLQIENASDTNAPSTETGRLAVLVKVGATTQTRYIKLYT